MTLFFGIDACKAGWLVAEAAEDLSGLRFSVVPNASELFARIDPADIAAIDIPIGLPINRSRQCDLEARRLLAPEGPRVFPVPARTALAGTNYDEATAFNKAALGCGLAMPTFAFMPKIAEVDACMSPELQARIREAHPEAVFRALAGRVLARKKSPEGIRERLDALKAHGIVFDPTVERKRLGTGVAVDDLLDAAACLLAARAVARGEAEVLGNGELDARGLRMEMVTVPTRERERVEPDRSQSTPAAELERIISDLRRLQSEHPNASAEWAYYEMALAALKRMPPMPQD